MSGLSDISLLLGIPSSREAFFDRIAVSDYLSTFALDPDSSWRQYERKAVAPLVSLAEKARSGGVRVVQDANLQSLESVTADNGVVIILSHWKGAEVGLADIVGEDVREFQVRLAALELSARLDGNGNWRDQICDAFEEYLTLDLEEEAMRGDQVSIVDVASKQTRRAERRDKLDIVFNGLLMPGNRLELSDGLHAKEDIEVAIGPGFRGVLDLTTCKSSFLSDYLDRTRKGTFRTVQFPATQDVDIACAVIVDVLDVMRRESCSYQEARISSLMAADELIRQAVRRQKGMRWLWRWTR